MRPTAGRWVSGDDFFDREGELRVLESHVRDRNHLLLTGQRRMGKTSIARELGRRMESDGWIFLFADVEGSTCPEDAVATIAKETYRIRPIASRLGRGVKEWFEENIEEVGAHGFRAKIRAGLNAGNWRRLAEKLLQECANQDSPVLLVIDELPIFLKRMLRDDGHAKRVDEFPELAARRHSDVGRPRARLHRVRQHRAPAPGPSPRDPGPNQSLLSHSTAALGPGDKRGLLQPSR